MSSKRGKLIVIEGIDGSGKTTIAKSVVNELKASGIKSVYTYEPYNEELIKMIESKGKELGAIMETLLLAADRYLHIKNVIEPYINKGFAVVCDRYYYSSIAYQGARGADKNWIRIVNYFVVEPDIAIYLDVDPELGIKRLKGSKRKLKYLEEMRLLHKVRENYLQMVNEGKLIYVDARNPIERVKNEVMKLIKNIL